MKSLAISIMGRSRSGKDTAAGIVLKRLEDSNIYAWNLKFSSPFKAGLAIYLGVKPEMMEDDTFRNTIIPELGMTPLELMGRAFKVWDMIHPQLGVYWHQREISNDISTTGTAPHLVFTDMRRPSEVDYFIQLKDTHSLIVINLTRRGTPRIEADEFLNENINRLINNVSWYAWIQNNGTIDNLSAHVNRVLNEFLEPVDKPRINRPDQWIPWPHPGHN